MSDTAETNAIQFKLVPELPLANNNAFDIVAVVNNKDTVRISWEALTANHISQTRDIPYVPGTTNDVPYITFSADETGLYINDGSSWRKAPSYGANWEDLTEDARFLLVNSPMTLSAAEIANARQSLKLGVATSEDLGLVKVSPTTSYSAQADAVRINEDGLVVVEFATPTVETSPEGVPGVVRLKNYYSSDITEDGTYAVTEKYVREAIANYSETTTLPIASNTSLGVVVVDPDTALTISATGTLSIKSATHENAGVVFLDDALDAHVAVDSHAASVGLVNTIVDRKVREVSTKIAGADLGMVRVPGDTAVTIDGVGNIDVRPATETVPGTVTVLGTLDPDVTYSNVDTGSTAVTPQAVTDYVEIKLSNLSQTLPIASATELGAIRVGTSVIVDSDTGALDITNATPTRLGGVYVSLAANDTNSTTVPTEGRVLELISSNAEEVGVARINKYGTVKLSLPDIIEDGAKIGVNAYGQLVVDKTTISSGIIDGEIGIAAKDTLGLVALSSSRPLNGTSSGPGLPIGSDSYGTIFVDSNASVATSSKLGLVKLGVSDILDSSSLGVGVDSRGQLRVNMYGSSGGMSYYMYETSKPSNPVNLWYYKEGSYNIPFIYTATASKSGAVMLGTDTIVTGGAPVGVDASGRLAVAINISGGTGGTIGTATSTASGVVKLSQDAVISGGLPIGVNESGQLVVASSSTNMTAATTSLLGGVMLSHADTIQTGFGSIGLNNNNQIVVAPAGPETAGVVKVGGEVLYPAGDPTVALVGITEGGQLAVKGVSAVGGGETPLHVTLIPLSPSQNSSGYIVTMTGGAVQLNDGTIVNIEAITEEDNVTVTLADNQTLSLKVFANSYGEPVAKLAINSSTKVLTCKPSIG